MSKVHFKLKWFVRGLLFAIGFIALFSLIVMLLWNWLMPSIFGLGQITYLQSAGLLILSKILFFGFGGRKGGHISQDKKDYIRKRFEEKFRTKFEERCGKESDEKESAATDQ